MKKKIATLTGHAARVIGSRGFWWFVIALFILQAAWVAILFRFPLLYDEHFHFNAIKAFSDFFSPIILHQSTQYDALGNLTFGNASIYHYLMSMPYRIIQAFTHSEMITVVILRLLNIAMAVGGFILYDQLFRKIGVRQSIINVAMFVFAFIPIVSTVAATISYDNMLFLLTPLTLLLAVRIITGGMTDWKLWAQLAIVGAFTSLVKFTFLPLFLAVIIFVGVLTYRKHGKSIGRKLVKSFRNTRMGMKVALIAAILVVGGLFGFRYGLSVIKYGTPIPSCVKTMAKERCLANPVTVMEEISLASKDSRKVDGPLEYTRDWTLLMANGFTVTSVNTPTGMGASDSPFFYEDGLGVGILIGILLLVYAWRSLKKTQSWYLLTVATLGLLVATMLFNMSSYYMYHQNVNIQPRYALSVLPIILVMGVVAVSYCLRRWRAAKMLLVVAMVLFTTQGGGMVTHIMGSKDDWYWNKQPVLDIERSARAIIDPFVKD